MDIIGEVIDKHFILDKETEIPFQDCWFITLDLYTGLLHSILMENNIVQVTFSLPGQDE